LLDEQSATSTSRFFYCAKASKREPYNDHPTLKPVKLFDHLVRLVTRPGQTVLDPFAGSGTTGVACIGAGRDFLLIEMDRHYCDICEWRVWDTRMGLK
jgi:site-specific DNA-methyltransferase (adenine-specific)